MLTTAKQKIPPIVHAPKTMKRWKYDKPQKSASSSRGRAVPNPKLAKPVFPTSLAPPSNPWRLSEPVSVVRWKKFEILEPTDWVCAVAPVLNPRNESLNEFSPSIKFNLSWSWFVSLPRWWSGPTTFVIWCCLRRPSGALASAIKSARVGSREN